MQTQGLKPRSKASSGSSGPAIFPLQRPAQPRHPLRQALYTQSSVQTSSKVPGCSPASWRLCFRRRFLGWLWSAAGPCKYRVIKEKKLLMCPLTLQTNRQFNGTLYLLNVAIAWRGRVNCCAERA